MANSYHDIDRILQYCLDKIQFGGAKVDHLLRNYPDVADELYPLLQAANWLMSRKEALDPRPEYLYDTWSWLISQR